MTVMGRPVGPKSDAIYPCISPPAELPLPPAEPPPLAPVPLLAAPALANAAAAAAGVLAAAALRCRAAALARVPARKDEPAWAGTRAGRMRHLPATFAIWLRRATSKAKSGSRREYKPSELLGVHGPSISSPGSEVVNAHTAPERASCESDAAKQTHGGQASSAPGWAQPTSSKRCTTSWSKPPCRTVPSTGTFFTTDPVSRTRAQAPTRPHTSSIDETSRIAGRNTHSVVRTKHGAITPRGRAAALGDLQPHRVAAVHGTSVGWIIQVDDLQRCEAA